jgi:hypothetical protein
MMQDLTELRGLVALMLKLRVRLSKVFFLVPWGGVRMSLLGTSATVWRIVPSPDDR